MSDLDVLFRRGPCRTVLTSAYARRLVWIMVESATHWHPTGVHFGRHGRSSPSAYSGPATCGPALGTRAEASQGGDRVGRSASDGRPPPAPSGAGPLLGVQLARGPPRERR